MITQQFFDKYNNKGLDFDGSFGFQSLRRPIQALGFTSSGYSVLEIDESSQVYGSKINLYSGVPSTSGLIPPYTTHAATIVNSNPPITYIRSISTNSQINSGIIERISIDMVYILTGLGLYQIAVKLFNFIVRKPFLNIEFISHFTHAPLTSKLNKRSIVSIVEEHIMDAILFTRNLVFFHSLDLNWRKPSCQ